ncbi:MAG: PadR family transcriptional regulator [Candidatus Lokiarchaeia archaeon]|nr:PadR family transcriptional regulator [Candidatus Lokiarchaeia archaeon]
MFKKDIDHFGFDNEAHRFKGQGPPERHDPPGPPSFGGFPPFGYTPPFLKGPLKPPLPIGREAFQEIRDFIVLLLISDYPDGITGYQLQDKFNFPRGTLIRTLQELEDKGYLESKEEIVDGRANKFFMITELGRRFLGELKLKWANIFGMMSEIIPSKGIIMVILEKIKDFEDKDDAIDFFRGLRSWTNNMLKGIEKRIEYIKGTKVDLDRIIKEIETMDSLDKDKVIEMVEETIQKREEYEFDISKKEV